MLRRIGATVNKTTKKNSVVIMKNNLPEISNYNFNYYVDYDYDTVRNCGSNCSDGICRCRKIINFKMTGLDINALIKDWMSRIFTNKKEKYYKADTDIFEYALDRIWSYYIKKYSMDDLFSYSIMNGYYGEEVRFISLYKYDIADKFDSITKLNNDLLIEETLMVEYGYLLDRLDGCHYEIDEVELSSIKIHNTDYYDDGLNRDLIEMYKNYNYFIALIDEDYRLIDGYHRVTAAKEAKREFVPIIKAVQ